MKKFIILLLILPITKNIYCKESSLEELYYINIPTNTGLCYINETTYYINRSAFKTPYKYNEDYNKQLEKNYNLKDNSKIKTSDDFFYKDNSKELIINFEKNRLNIIKDNNLYTFLYKGTILANAVYKSYKEGGFCKLHENLVFTPTVWDNYYKIIHNESKINKFVGIVSKIDLNLKIHSLIYNYDSSNIGNFEFLANILEIIGLDGGKNFIEKNTFGILVNNYISSSLFNNYDKTVNFHIIKINNALTTLETTLIHLAFRREETINFGNFANMVKTNKFYKTYKDLETKIIFTFVIYQTSMNIINYFGL